MPKLPSYRNQSIDLQSKSIDWFLYEGNTGNSGIKFKLSILILREREATFFKKYLFCVRVTCNFPATTSLISVFFLELIELVLSLTCNVPII